MFSKQLKIFIAVLFFILIFVSKLFAVDYQELEGETFTLIITEPEKRMINDAKDKVFNSYDLLEASLIAEGIKSTTYMREVTKKLDEIIADIRTAEGFNAHSDYDKAQFILKKLHQNLFRVYMENETTVLEVLRSGRYNCVSSSIIYNYVLEVFRIKTYGFIVPSHAFSVVETDGKLVEVQTTTEHGFDPNSNVISEFERLTGFEYISLEEANNKDYHRVENPLLLSALYSNLAVFTAKNTRNYNKALSDGLKALMIYPELGDARNNVLSILLNWMQYLSDERLEYDKAINFNKKAIKLFPGDNELKQNLLYLYTEYSRRLMLNSDYEKAIAKLQEVKNYFNNEEINNQLNKLIKKAYLRYGEYLRDNARFDKAVNVLNEAMSIVGEDDELSMLLMHIYIAYAKSLSYKGKRKSIDIMNTAIDSTNSFEDNKKTLYNAMIDVYKNLWSDKMRNKQYDGETNAFDILDEAEEYYNEMDKGIEYNRLLAQTYADKAYYLVGKNTETDYEKALSTMGIAYDVLGDDEEKINKATKYTLQEYMDHLLRNNAESDKVLSDIIIKWINESSNKKSFFDKVLYYSSYYLKTFYKNLWDDTPTYNEKKEVLNNLKDIVYNQIPSVTLSLLNIADIEEIKDFDKIKELLSLSDSKINYFKENGITKEDLDLLGLENFYLDLFSELLEDYVDDYSYDEAIGMLFNPTDKDSSYIRISTNNTIKNHLYDEILSHSKENESIEKGKFALESALTRYDNNNEVLRSMILGIHSTKIKNRITDLFLNKIPKDEEKRNEEIAKLEQRLTYYDVDENPDDVEKANESSINFLRDNNMHIELQKLYLIISTMFSGFNSYENALKYSLSGHLEYRGKKFYQNSPEKKDIFEKNKEALKKNTLDFYLKRAEEILAIEMEKAMQVIKENEGKVVRKPVPNPYIEPIDFLSDALENFDIEEQDPLIERINLWEYKRKRF